MEHKQELKPSPSKKRKQSSELDLPNQIAAASSASDEKKCAPSSPVRPKRTLAAKEVSLLKHQLAGLHPFKKPTSEAFELETFNTDGRGLGIVCREAIPRNRFVVEYRGELLCGDALRDREEFYSSLSPEKDPGCFMFYFKHNEKVFCIDGTSARPSDGFARFINHSRAKANLRPVKMVDELGGVHVVLYSLRDIDAGEELLFDYGDRDKQSLQAFPWLNS